MTADINETNNLDSLFQDTLQDIYYAEMQILKALPKMAEAAQSQELTAAFKKHQEETKGQIERLVEVFEIFGAEPKGKTCPAIDGIIKEGEETMKEYKDSPALDAGLIAAAQAVEHYEITRYGTLKRWAEILELDGAVELLEQTLQQESDTDAALTRLADAQINDEALRKVV